MTKILRIVSGADQLTLSDGSSHPTGFWAEEPAASHKVFRDAGVEVDIATPGGVTPTVDPIGLDSRGGVGEAEARQFRDYLESIAGELKSGPDWTGNVVVDGNLISGQNPQSSIDTAHQVLQALGAEVTG